MSIHINLVDMLVEARMGRTSKQYTSLKELRAYTITEKKYIRRTSIPPKSLLNYLLREIHMNKYNGFRRKSEDAPKEKEG